MFVLSSEKNPCFKWHIQNRMPFISSMSFIVVRFFFVRYLALSSVDYFWETSLGTHAGAFFLFVLFVNFASHLFIVKMQRKWHAQQRHDTRRRKKNASDVIEINFPFSSFLYSGYKMSDWTWTTDTKIKHVHLASEREREKKKENLCSYFDFLIFFPPFSYCRYSHF